MNDMNDDNNVPTPPDARTIEHYESATARHAVTAVAPLDYDSRKNRVTLKNLVRDVTQAVGSFAEPQAAPVREQLESAVSFARPVQRPASLCVFTDGTHVETLLLPELFPACVVQDTRYYVRPLIQTAATRGEFLLLALAQGDVRLYRMSGEALAPVCLETLPGSLTDVVGQEVDGGTLQHHATSGDMYHGQGKGHDDRNAELTQFLQAVDQALTDDVRTREEYLMVAAVDEVTAKFRDLSRHQRLLDETVTLSPDQTAEDDLRVAALDAFARWRERDNLAFLTRLHEEQRGRASSDSRQIVQAAEEGRVDTLLTGRDSLVWGRFDAEGWTVELHERPREGSRDLVDVAMRAAWRQGGQIRVLDDATHMANPLEARLRF